MEYRPGERLDTRVTCTGCALIAIRYSQSLTELCGATGRRLKYARGAGKIQSLGQMEGGA